MWSFGQERFANDFIEEIGVADAFVHRAHVDAQRESRVGIARGCDSAAPWG
jgi:hypothetical protein